MVEPPVEMEIPRGRAIPSRLARQLGDESLNILSGGNAQNLEQGTIKKSCCNVALDSRGSSCIFVLN